MFKDGKLAGGMHITPTVVIDLGREQPIERVRIHAWGGGSADTYFPSATTVWISDRGQWRPYLHRILPPPEPAGARTLIKAWLEASFTAPPTRYVKLDFVSHDFLLLDEIEVVSRGTNVAGGCAYDYQGPLPYVRGVYPDDGRKLTDGEISMGFVNHLRVAGYNTADPTVTVDLQRPAVLALASAHLCGGGWGGIHYPYEMSVQTSLDGATWSAPATTTQHRPEPSAPVNVAFPPPTLMVRTVGMMEVPLNTAARYVRWQFKRHGYCLVDEVEVYGQ